MEKSSRPSEVSGTSLWHKYIANEFINARVRLTFYYVLTAMIIIGGSSVVLYNTLLANIAEYIHENILDPRMADIILHKTAEILQNRFLTIDLILLFFVILIGFFLTKKTLEPIKTNMEKQNRFITDASHEFRTPVAVVISGLEVALRNKNLTIDQARKTLENTLAEMREFSKLSNHLLDISKHNSKVTDNFTPININDLVNNIVNKMSPIAKEKGVMIDNQVNNKDIKVLGNEIELGRVFYNVINNAINYNKEGGSIVVSESTNNNHCIIKVNDTGIGMDKETLSKAFDPFVRGDNMRSTSGAGLGLSIVKNIVEHHNGNINIKSEVDKGTIVTIKLPISS